MSCADVRALFRQKYPSLILMSCDSELSKFTSHTHTCTGTINYYGVRLGNRSPQSDFKMCFEAEQCTLKLISLKGSEQS